MKLTNNILIVGGTGFIGYHLAKKVLKKGWQVTSISSKPPKKIRYLPKVKYILCDITKKKFLKKNIQQFFKYVVNLGGDVYQDCLSNFIFAGAGGEDLSVEFGDIRQTVCESSDNY